MLLCLREPPVRFLWCYCSSFHFWSSFRCCSSFCWCSSFTFSFWHHPSPFHGLWPGFYTHFILSVQSIAEWFATLSFSTIPLSSCHERYGLEWAFFYPQVFFALRSFTDILNLRLSRPPWEPAVLPWSLQGFMLILETQTRPICLFDSQ